MARMGRSSQLAPLETSDTLLRRLDDARDLFILSLGLGGRGTADDVFGRMICTARVRFASVIEECHIAGLETGAIPRLLGQMYPEIADSMRPDVWQRLEAGRRPSFTTVTSRRGTARGQVAAV